MGEYKLIGNNINLKFKGSKYFLKTLCKESHQERHVNKTMTPKITVNQLKYKQHNIEKIYVTIKYVCHKICYISQMLITNTQ